jgi:hypothetical protein
VQDLLVNSTKFGHELAEHFSDPTVEAGPLPTQKVVLMRNHGFTVVGTSIEQAVYRAVYTAVNASVQTKALTLRAASEKIGETGKSGGMAYLEGATLPGCEQMGIDSQARPWGLWAREVEVCPLYVNKA